MAVPTNGNPLNEPIRRGAAFVTPPNGNPLQQALVSIEQQYAQYRDFRRALINGLNQTKEWEKIGNNNDPLGQNGNPLILDIYGDRLNNKTHLSIYKNDQNGSIELNSTWRYGEEVYLYIGGDGAELTVERFILSGITLESHCDTNPPSESPSEAPTASQNSRI